MGETFEEVLERASFGGFTVFATKSGSELVESFVVGPLTTAEMRGFDADMRDPDGGVRDLAEGAAPWFATAGEPQDLDTGRIGDAAAGVSVPLHVERDPERAGRQCLTKWNTGGIQSGCLRAAGALTAQERKAP